MNLNDYYQVGHVAKLHGLSGDIVVSLDVTSPEAYAGLDMILFKKGADLIPHFIDHIRISGNKARITLEEFGSRDEAQSLLGCEVYLPVSYLPELDDHDYYFHELIGFTLIHNGVEIGQLEKIYDLGAQNLFSFTRDGNEILVPLHQDILQHVDKEKKQIELDLPDGLLDIYEAP